MYLIQLLCLVLATDRRRNPNRRHLAAAAAAAVLCRRFVGLANKRQSLKAIAVPLFTAQY
jgi:hypothetical protein